jgi:hypothetical protein
MTVDVTRSTRYILEIEEDTAQELINLLQQQGGTALRPLRDALDRALRYTGFDEPIRPGD